MNTKERILSHAVETDTGCWIWQAKLDRRGYGQCWVAHRSISAHRHAYQSFKGPIPVGLELDHLCRTPACVNPDHLEPVTHQENMRRHYETYTHCGNGHEFTEANTYTKPNGYRDCRTCIRDRVRKYQSRERAA